MGSELHIGTMNSTLQVTDTGGLAPEAFERIVAAVVQRVREELSREQRTTSELTLRPRASDRT